MNILISGGTGFIGQALFHRLRQRDDQVKIISRKPTQDKSVVSYDGSLNSLRKIFDSFKPDIVVHLATYFTANHHPDEIAPLIESNLLFGTQLLEVMSEFKTKHFINTGTSWQHFKNEIYNPTSLYAATKQAFSDIVKFYHEACDLSVITLEIFDTYGTGDERKKLFPILKNLCHSQNPKEISMSEGFQKISCVYIDDVIDAFLLSTQRILKSNNSVFETFSVRGTPTYSIREIAGIFEECSQKKLPILWGARETRPREILDPPTIIENVPEWIPKISLKQGIAQYLKDL